MRSQIEATETAGAVPSRHSSARPLLWGLAASLLLAAGLAVWVAVLRDELASARQPRVEFPILDLQAKDFARSEIEVEKVHPGVERFVLILNLSPLPDVVEHRLEILDEDGQRLWSGTLWPSGSHNFYLELSRSWLGSGDFRLQLFRDQERVAEYELRVVP